MCWLSCVLCGMPSVYLSPSWKHSPLGGKGDQCDIVCRRRALCLGACFVTADWIVVTSECENNTNNTKAAATTTNNNNNNQQQQQQPTTINRQHQQPTPRFRAFEIDWSAPVGGKKKTSRKKPNRLRHLDVNGK